WLNQTWDFPDPDTANHRRTLKISDITTLTKAAYTYDDLNVPAATPAFAATTPGQAKEPAMRKDDELQLLAATAGGGSVDHAVTITAPAPVRTTAAAPAGGDRGLFLALENIGIDNGDASAMWNVYAQTPAGRRHLVGT